MPTYDYVCDMCGHRFDVFQSMKDDPLTICPSCSAAALRRVITGGTGVIFRGSGFYVTDSKSSAGSSSSRGGSSADAAETSSTGASDTAGSSGNSSGTGESSGTGGSSDSRGSSPTGGDRGNGASSGTAGGESPSRRGDSGTKKSA